MKPFLLIALLAPAACTNPQLTTGVAIGTDGVSVYPTLSGDVGGATIVVHAD